MKRRIPGLIPDQWLSWRVYDWLHSFPAIGLEADALASLLTSNGLFLNEAIWPGLDRGEHRKELQGLVRAGVIDYGLGYEEGREGWELTALATALPIEGDAMRWAPDLWNIAYSHRNGVPFLMSDRSLHLVQAINSEDVDWEAFPEVRELFNQGASLGEAMPLHSDLYRCVLQVEVPEERARASRLGEEQGLSEEEARRELFLSPEELLAFFGEKEAVETLRRAVTEMSKEGVRAEEVPARTREVWDRVAGEVRIGQWSFTAASLVPEPMLAAASAALGVVVNRFIKREEQWLYSLRSLNVRMKRKERGT